MGEGAMKTLTRPASKVDVLAQLLRERHRAAVLHELNAHQAYRLSDEYAAALEYDPFGSPRVRGPLEMEWDDAYHALKAAETKRRDYVRARWERREKTWPPEFDPDLNALRRWR
jgi:hypothetical protein